MSVEPTALVTGANRGLGQQVAKELAGRGYRVYLGTRRPDANGDRVEGVGGEARWLSLDVADSASVRRAAEWLGRNEPKLDVLVNNAGVSLDDASITAVPRSRLIETFQVNTFGPIEVTQALLPLLKRSDDARVLNVSSGCGQVDRLSTDLPSYGLSKLALNGATRMLADELAADGVAVNSVCPGWVRTDMGGAEAPSSVEEGAAGIVWLATEADHSLTGRFFRNRKEVPW